MFDRYRLESVVLTAKSKSENRLDCNHYLHSTTFACQQWYPFTFSRKKTERKREKDEKAVCIIHCLRDVMRFFFFFFFFILFAISIKVKEEKVKEIEIGIDCSKM